MITKILLWLILWFGIQGFTNTFLRKRGYTYTQKPLYTFITFLFGIILSYISFKEELADILSCYPKCLILPISVVLISFLIYFILRKYTKNYKAVNSSEYTGIKYSFLIFKTTDVIFQDILLLVIILIFRENLPNTIAFVSAFNIFFVLIHLPIMIFRKSNDSRVIVLGSLVLGILLPIVSLIPEFNISYLFITHWAFYVLGGIAFRTIPAFREYLLSKEGGAL